MIPWRSWGGTTLIWRSNPGISDLLLWPAPLTYHKRGQGLLEILTYFWFHRGIVSYPRQTTTQIAVDLSWSTASESDVCWHAWKFCCIVVFFLQVCHVIMLHGFDLKLEDETWILWAPVNLPTSRCHSSSRKRRMIKRTRGKMDSEMKARAKTKCPDIRKGYLKWKGLNPRHTIAMKLPRKDSFPRQLFTSTN